MKTFRILFLFAFMFGLTFFSVGQNNALNNLEPVINTITVKVTGFGTSKMQTNEQDMTQMLLNQTELNVQSVVNGFNDNYLISYGNPQNHDELIMYVIRQMGATVELVE